MADLIEAVYRGPFDGETAHGRTVRFGDVAQVTEADLQSGWWERAETKPARQSKSDPTAERTDG